MTRAKEQVQRRETPPPALWHKPTTPSSASETAFAPVLGHQFGDIALHTPTQEVEVSATGESLARTPDTQTLYRHPPDAGTTPPSATPATPPSATPATPATPPSGGGDTTQTWEQTGNLIGHPPVRDRANPPNKNIVEDEGVYGSRRAIAEDKLAGQKTRADSLINTDDIGFFDPDNPVKDNRYWFARVYQYVTEGELAHAASSSFYYPSYVMASVAYFEQIYSDNFNAFDNGGPVEAHWQKAFQTARDERDGLRSWFIPEMFSITRSLVASMQAHIRFDLPRAEAWVFNSYYSQFPGARLDNFRADFMSMSGVFDEAGRRMNTHIEEVLSGPASGIEGWLASSATPLLQDMYMRGSFGILGQDADMATERADTWQRAEQLVANGQAGADPYSIQGGQVTGNVTTGGHTAGLQDLPDEGQRPTMDSAEALVDDNVTVNSLEQMTNEQIAALPVIQRVRMLRGLFSGATVGSDESAILRILEASRDSSLVTIIDGADAWDLLYALDMGNNTTLRNFFVANYYGSTAQATAYRLIRKCLDGETAEWEEQMVVDLLEQHPGGHALVEQIGAAYPQHAPEGADKHFKDGLYKLEWQLDGDEETRLKNTFGESGLSMWDW